MSVVRVKQTWEGRGGHDGWDRRRTYTQTWEVLTDDPTDDVATVGGSLLLPRLGDPHPEDSAAVVVSVDPSCSAESPTIWAVQIQFDTQPPVPNALQPSTTSPPPSPPPPSPPTTPADEPENPLNRAPIWRITFETTTEPAVKTLFGAELPILNSAGLPFDPPPMAEVSRPVVSVTWNTATCNLELLEQIDNTVNDAEFLGRPARTLKARIADMSSAFENDQAFWTITVSLAYKRDTWDLKFLDCGYHEKVTESIIGVPTTFWRKIKDPYGNEPTEPVPLNGFGRKLAPGDTPIYKEYRYYPERDFATLLPALG